MTQLFKDLGELEEVCITGTKVGCLMNYSNLKVCESMTIILSLRFRQESHYGRGEAQRILAIRSAIITSWPSSSI